MSSTYISAELPFVIKVCGITSVEDGADAVRAGATALGFNFYRQSPRYVTYERAANLIRQIEGRYLRVGVFVNASHAELVEALSIVDLDVLQLHGVLPEELPRTVRIWRAAVADALPPPDPAFEAYLLDTPCSGFGGSGVCFDWKAAADFPARFVLAGGLDPGNVAEAIAVARPAGVDACSKLEIVPGQKDASAVRAFVRAASEAHAQFLDSEIIVNA